MGTVDWRVYAVVHDCFRTVPSGQNIPPDAPPREAARALPHTCLATASARAVSAPLAITASCKHRFASPSSRAVASSWATRAPSASPRC
jgi:hypothetical protein